MTRRIVAWVAVLGLALATVSPAGAVTRHSRGKLNSRAPHSVPLRPHAVVPAPTNVVATAGDSSALVNWSSVTGATRYVVIAKPNNATCIVTTTSCVVRGLANDVTYTLSVYAVGTTGMSLPSAPVTVTPRAEAPTPPTGVVVAAFGLHARVMWQPSSSPSLPVTSYTATASPGGQTCSTTSTSCTITDLTAGLAYSFSVTATNAAGTSNPSTSSSSVTVIDRPSAPQNVVAAPAPESIGVSFDAPTRDGGSVIDDYLAVALVASTNRFISRCHPDLVTRTCTLSGLATTTTYAIRVFAHNSAGYSVAATPSSTVTTGYNPPGTPLSVTATASSGSVAVSWSPPSSDGGGALTGYTVYARDGSGGEFTCTTATTSCSVTGLTNGTSYSITVLASNGAGNSAASSALTRTPGDVPGSPTSLVVTRGNSSLVVSWTAPAVTGGSAITSYVATADDGAGHTRSCTTSTTSCTITSLVNGTSYAVTVVATNITGNSSPSASSSETPATVAGAPKLDTVTSLDGSLAVAWSAPATLGGTTLTGYTVTVDDGDGGVFTCTTTSTTCTVSGLTNGVLYVVTVVATNSEGNSAASNATSATPYAVPSAPQSVLVTSGDATLEVAWSAPVSDGGSAVYSYTVTADDGDGGVFTCTTSKLTCIVTGLTNGTTYSLSVVALNNAGESPASTVTLGTPTPAIAAPSAPTLVSAITGNASLLVTWTPGADGGSAITGFTVYALDAKGTLFTCSAAASATSCVVAGLSNGTSYTVSVVATNDVGDSDPSNELDQTPFTTPSMPNDISVVALTSAITAYWTAPDSDGGSAITGYVAYAYAPGGGLAGSCDVAPTLYSCTITDLTNFVMYSVSVVAVNAAGESGSSASVNLPNPNVIRHVGTGWIAYDNWIGFVGSDPNLQETFSSATISTTYGYDCAIIDILPGPEGGIYVQNSCSDIFYVAADGSVTNMGYNDSGSGHQMAMGPNGEAVFATDNWFLHVYDYVAGEWQNKFLNGADCINGVAIDSAGRVWVSDICSGAVGVVNGNVFDGISGATYNVTWYGDLCSPYRLAFDANDVLYIGSDCWGRYATFDTVHNTWTYVSDLNGYIASVYTVNNQALPLDTDVWPHRILKTGYSAMPQTPQPSTPTWGTVYTWGATWVQGRWNPSEFAGLNAPITSYTMTVTDESGTAHSCTTSAVSGPTTFDAGTPTCYVTGLTEGVSYSAAVVATNAAGDSAALVIGSCTTSQPSVSVPAVFSSLKPETSTLISAAATSGLPISVSNLPPNWMVSVYVTHGTVGLSWPNWRQTCGTYCMNYWGGRPVMVLEGSEESINHDLANLEIRPDSSQLPMKLYVIATPNNILYNPATDHYLQLMSNWGTFGTVLSAASQYSLFGMQGYLAAPLTLAQYQFLYGYASQFYMAITDDPAYIRDPVTGDLKFSYMYANNDPTTSWTEGYQSDPLASFQKWFIVAGPLAGTQFAQGAAMSGPGGNGVVGTGVGVNGFVPSFCYYEPNNWAMSESTLMQGTNDCYNDMSATTWGAGFIEYGGMAGDVRSAEANVVAIGQLDVVAPKLHAATDFAVSGNELAGFQATWTAPDNTAEVGLSEYRLSVYLQNADGTETLTWQGWCGWWQTSSWLAGMTLGKNYRVVLEAINNWGATPAQVFFTPGDPYVQITKVSLSVFGNEVTGTWTSTETYGSMWFSQMTISTMDGTYVTECRSLEGPGVNTCRVGGLTASTEYRVTIQGYGWWSGMGGGASTTVTTADKYEASNYRAVASIPTWPYSASVTPDGAVWYHSGNTIVRILNGAVTFTLDTTTALPENVSVGGSVARADNSVVYYTTGYGSYWFDTGILVVSATGDTTYLASTATNCANSIALYGENSVVVSNFYGLTVIDLSSGESSLLPGTTMWGYNYSYLVPSNDGQLYFFDRSGEMILHRYDGVDTNGDVLLTSVNVPGINWQGRAVIDGYLYNYEYDPAYNRYTILATNLSTGTSSALSNFQDMIGAPSFADVSSDGNLVARDNMVVYLIYTHQTS
ncbi:MAG: fibronectin type III domain-containing protein [Acidobacteria bacterium]|nr:fibronectin type III domain-containing protein [Acidobacteriota bacterium]